MVALTFPLSVTFILLLNEFLMELKKGAAGEFNCSADITGETRTALSRAHIPPTGPNGPLNSIKLQQMAQIIDIRCIDMSVTCTISWEIGENVNKCTLVSFSQS